MRSAEPRHVGAIVDGGVARPLRAGEIAGPASEAGHVCGSAFHPRPGAEAVAEQVDGVIYLAAAVRNVGQGRGLAYCTPGTASPVGGQVKQPTFAGPLLIYVAPGHRFLPGCHCDRDDPTGQRCPRP